MKTQKSRPGPVGLLVEFTNCYTANCTGWTQTVLPHLADTFQRIRNASRVEFKVMPGFEMTLWEGRNS